jgi:hypothetical protein
MVFYSNYIICYDFEVRWQELQYEIKGCQKQRKIEIDSDFGRN